MLEKVIIACLDVRVSARRLWYWCEGLLDVGLKAPTRIDRHDRRRARSRRQSDRPAPAYGTDSRRISSAARSSERPPQTTWSARRRSASIGLLGPSAQLPLAANHLRGVERRSRRLSHRSIEFVVLQVHWPDPHVPIEETAGAMYDLLLRGQDFVRSALSNFSILSRCPRFAPSRRCTPIELIPLQRLERDAERDVLP